jgi:glycosyltransferase involved in cell wall biosynthesis
LGKLVSVIIPYYNSEATVIRALDSVLGQTYGNIEVVLVDDGSTDGGAAVVDNYIAEHPDIAFKHIRQKNAGPSAARNNGVKASSGVLVAFLDADDTWMPHKLRKQINAMYRYGYDVMGCNLMVDGGAKYYFTKKKVKTVTLTMHLLRHYMGAPCVVMKRHVFLRCGGFPEGQRIAEDTYLFWIATHKFKVGVINYFGTVCYKDLFGGSSGLSGDLGETFRCMCLNIRKLFGLGIISPYMYAFLYVYYILKHIRKNAIVFWRSLNK